MASDRLDSAQCSNMLELPALHHATDSALSFEPMPCVVLWPNVGLWPPVGLWPLPLSNLRLVSVMSRRSTAQPEGLGNHVARSIPPSVQVHACNSARGWAL